MAKSVTARRQGDEFQALFFWKQATRLLIEGGDPVQRVTFESDRRIFVDDVVVEYAALVLDPLTGQRFATDAYQCKYHVAQGITFTLDNLLDPAFLGNKQSMLQRLYDAYCKYAEKGEPTRLHVVSSAGWNSADGFRDFLSAENFVREDLYRGGPRSSQGQMRKRMADHLGIAEADLQAFLSCVRFDLGVNRTQLAEALSSQLQLAGLRPLGSEVTNTVYAELAWKSLERGKHAFDQESLAEFVRVEGLVDPDRRTVLMIRHQSLEPIAPNAGRASLPAELRGLPMQEVGVDLSALFRGGRLTDPRTAIGQQAARVQELQPLWKDYPNLEVAYYGIAHIPLVFWVGGLLNMRKPVHILEHNRRTNQWDLLSSNSAYPHLLLRDVPVPAHQDSRDIAVKFSVSYPVLDSDVQLAVPNARRVMELAVPEPALDSIRGQAQLEEYAAAFRSVLDSIHNRDDDVERVHVFYAGPVSLAFRCGQLVSPTIHPGVLVYNYVSQDGPRYSWAIRVNASPSSPDFLIQL